VISGKVDKVLRVYNAFSTLLLNLFFGRGRFKKNKRKPAGIFTSLKDPLFTSNRG